jgi:ribosomal protein S27E
MPLLRIAPANPPLTVVPCPGCSKPLKLMSVEPTPLADDFEDVTEACLQCGTELVRTVGARSKRVKAA